MEFHRIYDNMNAFSWGLAIAVLALLSLPFVLRFTSSNKKSNENALFIKVIFFGVAFFLSTYSVGLGGEFNGNHFIFALPFYMALIVFLLKNWNGENSAAGKLGLVSFIFLAIATLNLPKPDFDKRIENAQMWTKNITEAATYLDSKMDELGIDRYAFVGGHLYGIQLYGWTRHSPLGPYFNQQPTLFQVGAGDTLMANIKKADAVVIGLMEPWLQADHIYHILNEQFTEQRVNRFQIYFRKTKMRE